MLGHENPPQTAPAAGRQKDPKAIRRALGNRIRGLRRQQGKTQRDLADAAGIAMSQLAKMERGESNVTVATLLPVAEKLSTTICALFEGIG